MEGVLQFGSIFAAFLSSRSLKFRHCPRQLSSTIDLYFTFVFIMSAVIFDYLITCPRAPRILLVCAPALSSGELLYASLFHESFFLRRKNSPSQLNEVRNRNRTVDNLRKLLTIEQVWLRLRKNEADYINYKLISLKGSRLIYRRFP